MHHYIIYLFDTFLIKEKTIYYLLFSDLFKRGNSNFFFFLNNDKKKTK